MADHPFPLDPALQAEEDAYRALSGIYPSRNQEQSQETRRGSHSHTRLEHEGLEGYDREQGQMSGSGSGSVSGNGNGNGSGATRKKRSVPGGGDDGGVKKSRQSQSCDACRARKVKCDRPPPNGEGEIKDMCTHCAHLNLACTFVYVPKKRGPPNLYLRKLKEEGRESMAAPDSPSGQSQTPGFHEPSPRNQGSELPPSSTQDDTRYSEYSQPHTQHNPYLAFDTMYNRRDLATQAGAGESSSLVGNGSSNGHNGWNSSPRNPDMLMTLASASQPSPRPGLAHGPGSTSSRSFTKHNPYPSPRVSTHRPSFNGTRPMPLPQRPYDAASPLNSKSSPNFPPYATYPHNPNNPFDAILPRGMLYYIVDLYFDYIYALIPCLHKPSFMASLHDGREERPGEDEWIALVMAVVAGTLVQVPHAFVAIPKEEKKSLTERCYALVKDFLFRDFTEVTVSRCIIYYLSGFTARILGFPTVASMHFTCNMALVVRMRLNEESTYQNLSPVYRELCRRIFWLTYGADKSLASMDGEVVMIGEDECHDVALPAEVDDEYVGDSNYFQQPVGRTSVLTGFVYISKLFRIMGQFLQKKRADRRKPLSGVMLQMRLNEIADLYERVQSLMHNCPDVLKLDVDSDSKSVTSISEDWDVHASADIQNLFFDPKAPKAVTRDAFLVQQGNIYVTQQMARQMLLQYRDELLALQANELALESSTSADSGMMSSGRRMAEWTKALIPDDKDQIASDLLTVLQKIPISVIAVNSTSMMAKIRFVASSLLDTLSSPSGDTGGINSDLPVRLQKAQSYLWDFLRILSEIEALYLLCDEQKGQLAR